MFAPGLNKTPWDPRGLGCIIFEPWSGSLVLTTQLTHELEQVTLICAAWQQVAKLTCTYGHYGAIPQSVRGTLSRSFFQPWFLQRPLFACCPASEKWNQATFEWFFLPPNAMKSTHISVAGVNVMTMPGTNTQDAHAFSCSTVCSVNTKYPREICQ